MNSLFFLIPIALIFVAIAVRALFWAINSGQYDNLDTEAHRILFDDDKPVRGKSEPDPAPKDDELRD
ncbi:cbb3-type cytochrome oxidase assembly protein CcoS [Gilvimarinus xylanilyticus]|uniref:Cbb3-type cytochrome oxidase assembly protein CcoS n=1 Tax=Gilvimarinus xylanilyticus TaxID=2944139 RepID=A0A9X2KS57_9GAMM|nr:cbb3-type cytochrome oxidase assembly protein CcoS [Gilvimarinus xylanilyticus]